jgi:hypothetical protein
MKQLILLTALITILLPVAVYSQQTEPEAVQRQRAARSREIQIHQRELELREREMELEQQQAEMNFEREQQELELQARRLDIENAQKPNKKEPHPILILILVVNILSGIWVYQDIQKRSHESGIWIVIALLTGLLGTLVYGVIRLGDGIKQKA